ncbi:PAS domain-containing hybrid sensor histidine kinase/response regulator [Rhodoferax sp. PAMC 29310]|uniref:PAS domain-containing hybrid sensor histidine kinase/response regulator n=1 Tax=Rhodoferax sp. PAMC 29310 TaxID=2822760 RepID=UPI001F0ACD44|nr:ATP-binding protein [Rhodoferax sp. PAMC 29310]
MLGYAAAEVVNQITPAEISDPQELIARAESLSLELATHIAPGFDALAFKASRGIEDIYELTYIRKDGFRLPAMVSVTALRDEQNTIIGYLLISTDNTARKQADDKLRTASQYARSLIEANLDPLVTISTEGKITDVNAGLIKVTGVPREQLIGTDFSNYFTEPGKAREGYQQVFADGFVTDYPLTIRHANGRLTDVLYNASVYMDALGNVLGVFAAARDITARKRVEEERARLDQALLDKNVELENPRFVAEKANLAKSDFLSSMSHELRTPLGAILGFAQLIESGVPPPTAAQKRSIDQILKAGWYLLELINEILDLALIESGKLSLSEETVSLAEVMRECETMIEPQAQQRGIHVTFTPLERPRFVHADRTRVKQVLINLLSNAIKYNRIGGTVIAACTAGNAPNSIRITVHDTGAGLAAEQLAQLFQPFNRLGQKSNTEEGTGIGLVVCKRLVELMRGVIGVESTVGQGSVFWVELSLAPAPAAKIVADTRQTTALAQTAAQNDGPQRTLLYVEDNPANLMLVEDLIARRPDLHLLSARDGIRGIELARSALPDLILMDINLPDISGLQALRILAKDRATSHIPVIAFSANAVPSDIEKGLEAGFFRYLTKPIKVVEFMETLDVALKFSAQHPSRPANQEPLS